MRQSAGRTMGATGESTDAELVLAAQQGSRVSFEALVRRYQKPLYFLCYRYVRDPDAASDLAQRTFIRVLEKLGELRDVETFRGWLFRIGANLALNHLRDHARFIDEGDTGADEPVLQAQAHLAMETEEEAQALRRAVAELPTKQRMTLELRVFEELPFKEIATALETTEGAAKVNFHYAVKRLKTLLTKPMAGKVGKR